MNDKGTLKRLERRAAARRSHYTFAEYERAKLERMSAEQVQYELTVMLEFMRELRDSGKLLEYYGEELAPQVLERLKANGL